MADIADINEQLVALATEIESLEGSRIKALVGFGELALPELKDKAEFSEAAAEIEEMDAKIAESKENKVTLEATKAQLEFEQRERDVRRTCFVCNRVNPEGARFCEGCGGKLGDLPREFCKKCGTLNLSTLKFCGECGNKLDEA